MLPLGYNNLRKIENSFTSYKNITHYASSFTKFSRISFLFTVIKPWFTPGSYSPTYLITLYEELPRNIFTQ